MVSHTETPERLEQEAESTIDSIVDWLDRTIRKAQPDHIMTFE